MNEITLDEILVAAHDAEFSRYDNAPEHIFSPGHNRRMKHIFKIYEKRTAPFRKNVANINNSRTHWVWNRKTVIAMLIVIILAALAGCAVAVYCLGGFRTEPHSDNTQLFPINLEGCPQHIEEKYYLPQIPEGFELFDSSNSSISVVTIYINNETKQTITLRQTVKRVFTAHYDNENSILEEIVINDHQGLGLQGKESYIAAWDNGDYILEVGCDLPKSEVIILAESAKILEN